MQKTYRTKYSYFLLMCAYYQSNLDLYTLVWFVMVWSDLKKWVLPSEFNQLGVVYNHFPMYEAKQLGDPRSSLPLTSEKAVFWKMEHPSWI